MIRLCPIDCRGFTVPALLACLLLAGCRMTVSPPTMQAAAATVSLVDGQRVPSDTAAAEEIVTLTTHLVPSEDAAAEDSADSRSAMPPAGGIPPPAWEQWEGPYSPGDCWSPCADACRLVPRVREDARGVFNWHNAAWLGLAAGGAVALRESGVDAEVREYTARHPKRWGTGSELLSEVGDYYVQIPVLAAVHGYGLYTQDAELCDFSSTLVSAYAISGLSTVGLKLIIDVNRPTAGTADGRYGFPSFHASTNFAMAAVVDEYYGGPAGVAAYTVAGLIGWSRIDQRDHDLSDVLFGAAMGYVIGRSVAGTHLYGDGRVLLLPYFDPVHGTSGVMMDVMY